MACRRSRFDAELPRIIQRRRDKRGRSSRAFSRRRFWPRAEIQTHLSPCGNISGESGRRKGKDQPILPLFAIRKARRAHRYPANQIEPYTQTTRYRLSWPASLPNISARVAITYARPGRIALASLASSIWHRVTDTWRLSLSRYAQISGRGLTRRMRKRSTSPSQMVQIRFLTFFDKNELTLRNDETSRRTRRSFDLSARWCNLRGSTGTDELVRVTFGVAGASVETVWSPTTRTATSTISIPDFLPRRALVFGLRTKNGDSWIGDGMVYVYNVSAGEYLVRGLYHPHSLAELDGRLYLCESASSVIRPIVFPDEPSRIGPCVR